MTSRPDKQTVEQKAEQAGLNLHPFIELIITHEEMTPHQKPDAEVLHPFKRLAHERGIEESRVWYVGDEINDWRTTRNAGIRFVGVTTGLRKRQDFLDAGVPENDIIESVRDLPGYMTRFKL